MKIDVKIKSDGNDLISTGNFISFNGKDIEFILTSGDSKMTIVFEFKQDDSTKESKREFIVEGDRLRILFTNYNETRFTTEPAKIGNWDNRDLFILYYIDPLYKTELKSITYSIYLGKEVSNG